MPRFVRALVGAAILAAATAQIAKAGYVESNLVGSLASYGAAITDPDVINARGISRRPAGAGEEATGVLAAPWGIAASPLSGFGPFAGAPLVGDSGDGSIAAFDVASRRSLGHLTGDDGRRRS